jgi:ABC-2 type transport system permease protein
MNAQTRAIWWAQWRVMWNTYSRAPKLGNAFGLALGGVWYGAWLALAGMAFRLLSKPGALGAAVEAAAPGLLLIFLYWQLVPLLMAATGAALDMRKVIVYPIPQEQLFWIEVLLRATASFEMLLIVVGAALGALFNPLLPPWAALAAIPFIAFNLLLSAGIREVLSRVFARRRIREIAVFLFVITAALPQLLLRHASPAWLSAAWVHIAGPVWPWSACAAILVGHRSPVAVASLLAWTAAAYVFGRRQFERGLRFDADAAGATPIAARPLLGSWRDRLFRWPSSIFPDPLGALAEKELRTLARSPRFRLVFLMGFTFGLLIWLPMAIGGSPSRGVLAGHYLTMISVYALLLLGDVCFWNSLGFDRGAAQAYFAMPAPFKTVLLAKNIVSVFFVLLEISAIIAVCAALRTPMSGAALVEAYSVTMIVSLYLLGIGNLISVYNPRAADPSRSMRSGAAGRVQALLVFVYPLAAAPVLLAYAAQYAFDSAIAFYVVLGFSALIGAAVYWVAMDSAAGMAQRDAERIVAALSRGDGPIEA